MILRLAEPQDISPLADLMRSFSIEVDAELRLDHIEAALEPILADQSIGDIWVLEHQKLIGYLVITWGWGIESGGKEGLIDELYVAKEFRGQGLAKAMLEAAISRAQLLGTKAIFLETEANNPKSRDLYKGLGFEVEDSVWMRLLLKADD